MSLLFYAPDLDSFCVEPEPNCSSVHLLNQSYSTFSVGPIPCYVGIVSDFFSCIASIAMVALYIIWADIRQNLAQAIVTFIAIADFFTAAGYMTSSFNLLAFMFGEQNDQECGLFTTLCEIQSYIVTCATMSSYFWTIILAIHFYVTIAHERTDFTKKLVPIYHLIGWGVPIFVAFPLLCFGKLVYAPFVTGMWCYMEIHRNSLPFSKKSKTQLLSVLTQLPEVIAFLVIIVFFTLTWIKIYRQAKRTVAQTGLLEREQTVAMERVSRVGRILLFIPVLFVLLRVWAVVQYLYTVYLTHLTDPSGRCIPTDPHKTIHVVLGILQAIGGGGQAWTNAILYIFLSPRVRQKLFCCCSSWACIGWWRKTESEVPSTTTQCDPPLDSVSTESLLRNWDVV